MAVVELLQRYHDRQDFRCGSTALDEFIQRHARQNADRNVGVTHVAVASPGDAKILGCYTLVTRTVDSGIVPVKGLPPGPVGVALLGRLAVHVEHQGQGLGKLMLLRALRQTGEAAKLLGIYGLVLDAMDDRALNWYLSLGWGFQALRDDPRHLYVPVSVISQLEL